MAQLYEKLTKKLLERQLITQGQFQETQDYLSRNIFSINGEILFLFYFSVVLFTSGAGIFIYKNIDSIGHLTILALNFLLMIFCLALSFRKAKGYSPKQISFDNPVHDYVLLAGSILACTFIGYANYQFHLFGTDYRWVSLFSAVFYFFIAYYFDSKTILSMAITALAAFVGISISPNVFITGNPTQDLQLWYSGFLLGAILIGVSEYLTQEGIKEHFHFIYSSLSLHLMGISILGGLVTKHWLVFAVFAIPFVFYFMQSSYKLKAISLYVFSLIHSFIAFNIAFWKVVSLINSEHLMVLTAYLSPFFYILSIYFFIQLISNFKKKTHDSI